jgi:hypothetical protein
MKNTTRRSYITTAPFDNYFFSYSVTIIDLVTTGTLTQVSGATCANCPTGRILRENGRKLYPDANPGVTNYMVGVYDSVTFLNGFIDPNADIFAVYNSDKPTYIADNGDSGPPVLTTGNIISTEGFVGVQSTIRNGNLYAGEYLYNSLPLVEAGVNYPVDPECDTATVTPQTYATLYPNGTIQSINQTAAPSTMVVLTANGNIFNTGNVSTIGDMSVRGNISTIGSVSINGFAIAKQQIRSTTKTDLTIVPGTGDLGRGGTTIDVSLGQLFTVTNLSGASGNANFQINASNTNLIGAKVHIIIINNNGVDRDCVFGNNIREVGDLGTLANGGTYCASFICDGVNLIEFSRAGPILTS